MTTIVARTGAYGPTRAYGPFRRHEQYVSSTSTLSEPSLILYV